MMPTEARAMSSTYGDSLLDRMAPVLDRGQADMHHFMGEFPVVEKVLQRRVRAHGYPAMRPAFTEAHSTGNALAI